MPKVLPFLALLLLSFCTLEVVMRYGCVSDQDGTCTFRSTRLKPYTIPVKHLEECLTFNTTSNSSGVLYDPELGWALRPNVLNHNAAGFITSGPVPPLEPSPEKLRIALVGDSYTQGNFDSGWWRQLEQLLNAAGIPAEILNFGVGGYGLDQAYLRLHRDCLRWKPQIVIYGLFTDDFARNLNVFRAFRDYTTGIPFMKPRFVLEGEGMRLVNSPTPPPGELRKLIHDFSRWPGLEHERFYNPEDYRMKPWHWSRMAAFIEAKLAQKTNGALAWQLFKNEGEADQIAHRILRRMRNEVETSGASFHIACLPCQAELERLQTSEKLPQSQIVEEISKEFSLVETGPALLQEAQGGDLSEFFAQGHYKKEFDGVVAKRIYEALDGWWKKGQPGSAPCANPESFKPPGA